MKRIVKKVSDSALEGQFYQILPNDLNDKKTLFGGRATEIFDEVAGYVALSHGNCRCFTRRTYVEFFSPAKIEDVLIFKASVNRVWKTSMEIGVKAFTKNLITGETRHFLSGYSTLVTVDLSNGKPIPVPAGLKSVSKDEKRRYREAGLRRSYGFGARGSKKTP